MRHEFPYRIKRNLALRVAHLCSNPSCKILTIGPSSESLLEFTSKGVAAHICAAAKGGPRFNEKMTPDEIMDISNGIWVCHNCSDLIDKEPLTFTAEILHSWKERAENDANELLQGRSPLPVKPTFSFEEEASYIPRKVYSPDSGKYAFWFDKMGNDLRDIILSGTKKVVLLGYAGDGKTTELIRLAKELSLPNLEYYVVHKNIGNALANHFFDINELSKNIPDNKLVFILDALDEASSDFPKALKLINGLQEKYPSATYILSTRTNFYLEESLSSFSRYIIKPFSKEDIDDYLKKKTGLSINDFWNEIKAKGLDGLVFTPFYCNKFVEQFINRKSLSRNKFELFEQIIAEGIENDLKKYQGIASIGSKLNGRRILDKVAFSMEFIGRNYLSSEELRGLLLDGDFHQAQSLGTIFYKDALANDTWKFKHNNLQEYLVARLLMSQEFKTLNKLLFLAPTYTKLKPSWLNTLSILISIYEGKDKRKGRIINLLEKYNDDSLITIEPDKLDNEFRNSVFQRIFNKYKQENRYINWRKYSWEKLAIFSETDENFAFLLNLLETESNPIVLNSAFHILLYWNIENRFHSQSNSLKTIIRKFVFEFPEETAIQAFDLYTEKFKLSDEEFHEVFNRFKDSKNSRIGYLLPNGIRENLLADKYLDFLLERITQYAKRELHSDTESRYGNEPQDLLKAALSIKRLDSFGKLFNFLVKNYETIYHSIYFRELLDLGVSQFKSLFPADDSYLDQILELFHSANETANNEFAQVILDYIDSLSAREKAFEQFSLTIVDSDYWRCRSLAVMATEAILTQFANKVLRGEIKTEIAASFQQCLPEDFATLFNSIVFPTIPIPLLVKISYDVMRNEALIRERNSLFSTDVLLEELRMVFKEFGKETINYDDYHSNRSKFWAGTYPPTIYEMIRIDNPKGERTLERLSENILANWNGKWIERIYEFCSRYRQIEFTTGQIGMIRSWCDEKMESYDFKQCIRNVNDSIIADPLGIKLCFFIRKFDFSHYDKSTYLDMLSSQSWGDTIIKIFEFVIRRVDFDFIKSRILENLKNGIISNVAFIDHVEFCNEYVITEATYYLPKYLTKPDGYQRNVILSTFIKLNGDPKELEKALRSINSDDYFRFSLIAELIKQKNPFAREYLRSHFNPKEADQGDNLNILRHLVLVEDEDAIKFLVNEIIIKKNKVVFEATPDNPLYRLRKLKFIPLMLRLLKYSSSIPKPVSSFESLEEIATQVVWATGLHDNQFFKTKAIVNCFIWLESSKLFFKKNESYLQMINTLKFHLENMERQYYINQNNTVTLQEAAFAYSKL